MKQRIIVMNGQKILQSLNNNIWKTSGKIKKVEEGIEPGIYNIYMAEKGVTTNEKYEGLILLVDKQPCLSESR